MTREERNKLLEKKVSDWSDAELSAFLIDKYTADNPPPCRVCGGKLSIASCGGGRATEWACSPMEDDPEQPGRLRRKADRGLADDHYSRSGWTQYRDGDEAVLELVRRLHPPQPTCHAPPISPAN